VNVEETDLPGVLEIAPRVFDDGRGQFFEAFRADAYARLTGTTFVQDNVAVSGPRVLRGLHLQEPHGQAKLVSVLVGEVYDVAVDVRVGSPAFGRWTARRLSEHNRRQLFIPAGFAHGYVVLGDGAVLSYKCSDYYHAAGEISLRWDDPELGIEWPLRDVVLSGKDASALTLREARDRLPRYDAR